MLWSLSDRLRTRNYMEMLKSGARKLIQMTKNFGVKNDLNEKNIYIVFGAATYTFLYQDNDCHKPMNNCCARVLPILQ